MKITSVEWQLYTYEMSRPLGDVNKPEGVHQRTDLALWIKTDDEVEGVAIGSAEAAAELRRISEIVLGLDPRGVRGLWEEMIRATFKTGNHGAISAAIAAVDLALWDLVAKINGNPLWRELGATTNEVGIYASGRDTPLTDEQLNEFYTRMAAHSIRAGKLKVGSDPDADIRRLGIMESALGGRAARPILLVDVNEFWTPKQAARRLREMEGQFDIAWCEEPVGRYDHGGLRQVSQSIRAAVATGENLRSIPEFASLLRAEAADVVQIGHLTSGITGALRVADLAYAFERPVSIMNCPGELTAHLAAVLPHHTFMEVDDAGRDVVFDVDSVIKDGKLVLGKTPGLGLTFDYELLERHKVDAPDYAAERVFGTRARRSGV